jgi:hypothetical protein
MGFQDLSEAVAKTSLVEPSVKFIGEGRTLVSGSQPSLQNRALIGIELHRRERREGREITFLDPALSVRRQLRGRPLVACTEKNVKTSSVFRVTVIAVNSRKPTTYDDLDIRFDIRGLSKIAVMGDYNCDHVIQLISRCNDECHRCIGWKHVPLAPRRVARPFHHAPLANLIEHRRAAIPEGSGWTPSASKTHRKPLALLLLALDNLEELTGRIFRSATIAHDVEQVLSCTEN